MLYCMGSVVSQFVLFKATLGSFTNCKVNTVPSLVHPDVRAAGGSGRVVYAANSPVASLSLRLSSRTRSHCPDWKHPQQTTKKTGHRGARTRVVHVAWVMSYPNQQHKARLTRLQHGCVSSKPLIQNEVPMASRRHTIIMTIVELRSKIMILIHYRFVKGVYLGRNRDTRVVSKTRETVKKWQLKTSN